MTTEFWWLNWIPFVIILYDPSLLNIFPNYMVILWGVMFFSITWEEAILGHLWKQIFITCWSKELWIGNPTLIMFFSPFGTLLLNLIFENKRSLCFFVCSLSIFGLHTSIGPCSRYFVIPLWKGSGYTTMFAQGTASNHWLHIIYAFVNNC